MSERKDPDLEWPEIREHLLNAARTPEFLWRDFELRRLRNPRYSLRAHAKRLGLSPSFLSEVLAGKRSLSQERMQAIADALGLSEPEKSFLNDLLTLESRGEKERELARDRIERERFLRSLPTRGFSRGVASYGWRHAAMHELLCCLGAVPPVETLAKALGLTPSLAEKTLQDLIGFGILRENESGNLLIDRESHWLKMTESSSSENLDFALEALSHLRTRDEQETKPGGNWWFIYSINPEQLEEVRALWSEYIGRMQHLARKSSNPTLVRCFFCLDYPLT